MKRYISIIALLFSLIAKSFAQDIEGLVLDKSGLPLSGVAVTIYNCADTLRKLSLVNSDSIGRFVIKASKDINDCLKVSLSHMGYKPLNLQEISYGQVNYFILDDTTKVLDEVVITAERPMVKLENGSLVYSGSALLQMGKSASSAYGVLGKLPGVSLEKGTVSLIGMPSTTRVINGRKTLLPYNQIVDRLKAIAPEMVERIEIRYDSAPELGSTHSSINVILKKMLVQKPFQADLNTGVDISRRITPYGNFTINTHVKSLSVQAHYSYVNENNLTNQSVGGTVAENIAFSEFSDNKIGGHFHRGYFNLLLPVSADSKQQIALNYNVNVSASTSNNRGQTDLGEGQSAIDSYIKNNTQSSSHALALSYASPRLSIELQGMTYQMERRNLPILTERLVPQLLNQQVYRWGITIDYNQPIKGVKGLKFIAGEYLRGSMVDNEVRKTDKHLLATKSKDTEIHSETYAGIDYALATWMTFKANLVYSFQQDRWSKAQVEEQKSHRLYPTTSFTFRLPKRNVLMLSYSSEIKEPSYWQLTPALSYISELISVQGNPSLIHSRMNLLRINWINKGKYITQLFIQDTRNHITQQLYIGPEHPTATYHSINMAVNRQLGLMTVVPFHPITNLDLRLTGTLFYLMNKGEIEDIHFNRSKLTGRIAVNMSYSPSKSYTCYLDGYYVTPMIQGIYDVSPLHSLDIGMRWFIKKNLSISLDVQDILRGRNSITKAHVGNQHYRFTLDNDTRAVKLGLRWTLGDNIKKNKNDINKDRLGIK